MSKAFRIDWYPHDWLLDTSRLENDERGVFIQVVCLIYANNGPIENDPAWIGQHCKLSRTKTKTLLKKLILKGFLSENESKISQKRSENELKNVQNRRESASKAGQNGNKTRWGNEENQELSDRDPISDGIASTSTSTSTSTSLKKDKDKSLSKKGSRLPDEWTTGSKDREYAIGKGLSDSEITHQAEKFRNYWTAKTGKDACKTNWHRTWQNWILNYLERNPRTKQAAKKSNHSGVSRNELAMKGEL